MKLSQRLQIIAGVLLILLGVGLLLPQGAEIAHAATTFLGLTDTPASYSGKASRAVAVNGTATALDFADNVFITDTYVRAQNVQAEYAAGTSAVAFRFFHTGAPSSGDKVVYDLGIYDDDENMFFRGYDGSVYQYFLKTDWDTGGVSFEAGHVGVPNGDLTAQNVHAGTSVYADADVEAGDDLIAGDDLEVADDATITDQLVVNGAVGIGDLPGEWALYVDGSTQVTGHLGVEGGIATLNDAAIFGDLEVGGDIYVTYNVEALGVYADSVIATNLIAASEFMGGDFRAVSGDIYTMNSDGDVYTQQGDIHSGDDLTCDANLGIGEYATPTSDHVAVSHHAEEYFSNAGDAQFERYMLYGSGTMSDANWHIMQVGQYQSGLDMPENTVWTYHIQVSMTTEDVGETAAYDIVGTASRASGSVTKDAETLTVLYEDDSSWEIAVVVGASTVGMQFRDSDGGGDAVRVVATVELTSVTY